MLYCQVPNLSQTNSKEIYASQTASIEPGAHRDMEFLLARNATLTLQSRRFPSVLRAQLEIGVHRVLAHLTR